MIPLGIAGMVFATVSACITFFDSVKIPQNEKTQKQKIKELVYVSADVVVFIASFTIYMLGN